MMGVLKLSKSSFLLLAGRQQLSPGYFLIIALFMKSFFSFIKRNNYSKATNNRNIYFANVGYGYLGRWYATSTISSLAVKKDYKEINTRFRCGVASVDSMN
jgi:hypothetical protein